MTLLALILKRRLYDRAISKRLAYSTLGLLFVKPRQLSLMALV
ncbi:putative Na+/H+ antiporter [Verrucomicrobium spinosum]